MVDSLGLIARCTYCDDADATVLICTTRDGWLPWCDGCAEQERPGFQTYRLAVDRGAADQKEDTAT